MKPQNHPKPVEFITASGKTVKLEAIHLELSLLEWLEGDLLFYRDHFLSRLDERVGERFGNTGLHLSEPPAGPLPLYALYASLHCNKPIQPENDTSSLIMVWFSDSLPADLQQELRARFKDVDWEAYAKDGSF